MNGGCSSKPGGRGWKARRDHDNGDEEPEEEEIDTLISTARRPFAVKRAVAIYGVPVFLRCPGLSRSTLVSSSYPSSPTASSRRHCIC
ncbi:hypothetical protein GUJ93_ZPchr0009g1450 [Zizania palustris]|uniref:Uncharacterized protein n=1 Tax=Zizania palustris TaxID=103762 RepID=A0A8J5V6W8_ZIZPA|nr:hypothetical protein GUJ93_ZPchr0009g1450 [Zizania palustris]